MIPDRANIIRRFLECNMPAQVIRNLRTNPYVAVICPLLLIVVMTPIPALLTKIRRLVDDLRSRIV